MSTDDTLADLAERLEAVERRCAEMAALIGPDHLPAEYVAPDGSVHHTLEEARWVGQGDWVQAVHGDTEWREVLHPPTHSEGCTGLVTRRADGSQRIRWWAHTDLVRVAETPVRVVAGQERRWDR